MKESPLCLPALAIGIVLVSLMTWVRVDLMGLLIGDVLAVTKADLVALYAGGMIVLVHATRNRSEWKNSRVRRRHMLITYAGGDSSTRW